MSGFVGLWQRDGQPADPAQLAALTESLRFRGPDGVATWRRGAVGFGHARFTTHAQRDGEPQPLGLDDRYWITGDIRLDAREELIAALPPFAPSSAERVSRGESDAALVLRAFRAWGEDCVARIHGDFAFAIWDERAQRLYCARDRFGVRPFFYVDQPGLFLFGNTLDTLRRHPRVDSRPYEPALADYLVVGNLLEVDRSFYADIRRLPPAHTLTLERGTAPRVARYWSLPTEPELRYRRSADYVEHFTGLLERAVADRAPPGAVTLFLSGGLDSAAIAATLRAHAGADAICLGWSKVFADPEPGLARVTARALDLRLAVHEFADCEPFKGWDRSAGIGPEPEDDFYRANTLESLALAGARSRVTLSGRGGDEVFAPEFVLDELRRRPGLAPLRGAAAAMLGTGRRPPLGLRALLDPPDQLPAWLRAPAWLNAGWLESTSLAERLHTLRRPPRGPERAPRANSRYRFAMARWTTGFEFSDAGSTGVPVDCRYPFTDLRLVSFALRLPALPWCADKFLLRRALAGRTPASVHRRRKTPLVGDPFLTWIGRNPGWNGRATPELAVLGGRVREDAWSRAWAGADRVQPWRLARAVALSRWLNLQPGTYAALRAVA